MPNPNRTLVRSTRFAPQEWARVEELSEAYGIAPATLMREATLGVELKPRPGALEREVIYHLARIGNNLNQLAHAANALKQVELSSQVALTLGEVRAAMQRVTR